MVFKIDYRNMIFIITISFLLALFFVYVHFFRFKVYEVVIEHPISGLSVDAPVEFNGVMVGHVSQIMFDSKNPQRIALFLHIKKGTPITRGTVGKVDLSEIITEKLTGFPYTYISLRDSGKDSRLLERGLNQSYPIIPMLAESNVVPSLVKLSQAIQQSNNAIEPLFTPENVESLKELVFSLQQLTAVLAKNSQNLDVIMMNTKKASDEFEPFLKSTNETLLTLKTETLPQVYDLTQNANDTLLSVQKLVGKINNNPTLLIRGEGLSKLGPGETVQPHQARTGGKE